MRLPFALLGILSVYVFYLLIRKYSKNIKFALVSSFLLTVAPWHIIESRIFSWGMIVFTLVTAGLLLIPQNIVKNYRSISYWFFVISFLLFAFSIFSFPTGIKNEVDYRRNLIKEKVANTISRIYSNKLVESYKYKEKLLFENFDFGVYFFGGFPRERWGVEEYKKLLVTFLPFLIIGLIALKRNPVLISVTAFTGVSYVLAASEIRVGSFGLLFLLIFIPIISYGIYQLGKSKYRLLIYLMIPIFLFEFTAFWVSYVKGVNESQFSPRSEVYAKIVPEVEKDSLNVEKILVSPRLMDPEIYFNFYSPKLLENTEIREYSLKNEVGKNYLYVGVLSFDPSPSEELYQKDGKWPEHINVLAVFEDPKLNQKVVIYKSKL